MTLSTTASESGDHAALLGRRAFVRGALAGGVALAAIFAEAAFHGVDARRKPLRRPLSLGTSGGNNTGSNGTGSNTGNGSNDTGNSQTGQNAGGDTTGTSTTVPPTQGSDHIGTSVHCVTHGAIVDANNPANNRPAETVCTTSP